MIKSIKLEIVRIRARSRKITTEPITNMAALLTRASSVFEVIILMTPIPNAADPN